MQHFPGFLQLIDAIKPEIREISTKEVERLTRATQGEIIIDVREDEEWNAGHLPNAMHLSKGIIERDIEAHAKDPNTLIVLYCGGGYRSALAAHNLQKMGYTNVHSMAGGFRAWKEEKRTIL